MEIKKKHIWFLLLCIYVTAVAVLCFMKPEGLPKVSPDFLGIPIDKVVHFMMFFPFPFVAYEAFKPRSTKKSAHIAVLLVMYGIGLALAIGTEHVQGQLGYRSEDIKDFYSDSLGISCSAVLTMIYILIKKI